MITCFDPLDIPEAFDRMERMLSYGHYLAGFISYEAGEALAMPVVNQRCHQFPLIYMGCYKKPAPGRFMTSNSAGYSIQDAAANRHRLDYYNDIARIKDHIERGDVYQITYCIKMHFNWDGDPVSIYNALLRRQPVPYPAYIETPDFKILSFSPEMFFRKTGSKIVTKPMKGTWPRGNNCFSDALAGWHLHYDVKNRAENVMITDLLRNDLGRFGWNVRVPRLYEVRKYNFLHQMTSTVTAQIPDDIPLITLFSSLFPSGSVTGAPKIRAMEIIREIEKEERRIYTGAIGYISPRRDMYFNIPIRTMLLNERHGEMGIGGGIVWDSTARGEWDECMLKAGFIFT